MQKIKRSALVPFSSEQMFLLVDDIEKYPEFVPYCKKTEVLKRSEQEVSATIEIAKGSIAKAFSTINQLEPHQQITMRLLDGPFKYLQGHWLFSVLSDDACKIELLLEFEFSNKLTSIAFAGIFSQLAEKMVSAFCDRAKKVYQE